MGWRPGHLYVVRESRCENQWQSTRTHSLKGGVAFCNLILGKKWYSEHSPEETSFHWIKWLCSNMPIGLADCFWFRNFVNLWLWHFIVVHKFHWTCTTGIVVLLNHCRKRTKNNRSWEAVKDQPRRKAAIEAGGCFTAFNLSSLCHKHSVSWKKMKLLCK